MLTFSPKKRITPIEGMTSPFFDEIRNLSICKLSESKILI